MKLVQFLFRFSVAIVTFLPRILILIITVFFATGCSTEPATTLECSVLIDVTNSNVITHSLEHVNTADIKKLLNIKNNGTNHKVIYRQSLIEETFLNKHHEFILQPPPTFFKGNFYNYKSKLNTFLKNIDSVLTTAKNDKSGRVASSVYIPMVRQLRKLSASKNDENILVIFSDLIENTDFLSFLDETDNRGERMLKQLVRNPKSIEKILQEEMPMPNDLQGIKVYLIHDASTATERYFKPLLKLYEKMLTKRGAIVISSANL
ncbi:hypothetical protein [Tenacibaculum halocynthiae]|uniref:hypothetical protein n=1 Tax=Tenacibaculum halocynthiae TaxID=1254437 RepID=UPI003D660149